MKNVLNLVILASFLCACASAGVQVKSDQLAMLKKGETTVSEAIARLGPPTSTSTSSDGSKILAYTYVHTQTRPETFIPYVGVLVGGADMKSNSAILTFGPDGKLSNYTSSEGALGTGIGFASGTPQTRTDQPKEASQP